MRRFARRLGIGMLVTLLLAWLALTFGDRDAVATALIFGTVGSVIVAGSHRRGDGDGDGGTDGGGWDSDSGDGGGSDGGGGDGGSSD